MGRSGTTCDVAVIGAGCFGAWTAWHLAREGHPMTLDTLATLARLGIAHEKLPREELGRRYPQIAFEPDHWGVLEPELRGGAVEPRFGLGTKDRVQKRAVF